MAAQPPRVAVDTNILLDLANKEEAVLDAIATLRRRIKPVKIVATPPVLHELANLIDSAETAEIRRATLVAAQKFHRVWNLEPAELATVEHGIAERISISLRERGVLPEEEIHDELILA